MKKTIFSASLGISIFAMAMTVNTSNLDNTVSDLHLANIEAISRSQEAPVKVCPGGPTECDRVLVGNTVHIFYME